MIVASVSYDEIECCECKERATIQEFKIPEGGQFPPWSMFHAPAGWHEINSKRFCPKHKVEITVDGKELK